MATVTINGTDYTVYADEAAASLYLQADLSRYATWGALSTDDQKRALVSSTRWIDRQCWGGVKASSDGLEFGRTGLKDSSGNELSAAQTRAIMEESSILLASDIAADNSITNQQSSGSNIKRTKAGSAEVEYFRSTMGTTTKFPTAVHDRIGMWLCSATSSAAQAIPYAAGTDVQSEFTADKGYDLFEGYP